MQAPPFVSQLAPPNWIPVKMSTVKTLYSPSAQTDEGAGEEGGSSCCFEFCFPSTTFARNSGLES